MEYKNLYFYYPIQNWIFLLNVQKNEQYYHLKAVLFLIDFLNYLYERGQTWYINLVDMIQLDDKCMLIAVFN